jgi:hypothetical protein
MFTHTPMRQARICLLALAVTAAVWLGNTAPPAHAQNGSGITSPAPGSAINGDVPILGTAVTEPFARYELYFKQEPSGDQAYIYFSDGTSPVVNGQLGVWQANSLPPGTYTLRLRVVKPDGNYAEYFVPNLSVNQAAPTPTPTATSAETPTPTLTFTPAPQPTPVIGAVTQPEIEGDEPPTPTPAAVAAVDTGQTPAAGGLFPTATPDLNQVTAQGSTAEGDSLSRQLGESLGFQRLQEQFFNGVRVSAAVFVALLALVVGKRLFEWVWRKYG